MLASLRQRNYFLLWVGGLVSSLGDWFLFIALPFYIYNLTGSALATGSMFIVESLPSILFGSLAGVFVDRWDRRRTMIVADVCRGVLLLLLLTAGSRGMIWVIYVVTFVESSIGQFFGPAKSALIPRLVAERELVAANSLISVSGELTRLVGPALGGAVFGLFGLASVVVSDAASFLFSAAMVLLIALPTQSRIVGAEARRNDDAGKESSPAYRAESAESSAPLARSLLKMVSEATEKVWREFADGLQLMRASRLVSALLVIMGVSMIGQGIINVMLIPFVKDVLHGDALVLGWIASAQGIGGLVGGLIIGHLGELLPRSWLVAGGLVLTGLLIVAAVNTPWLWLILALIAVIGLAVVAFAVGVQTLLQADVADRYRGRIFGAYNTVQSALMLFGMALASALGGPLGSVQTFDVAGILTVTAGVAAAIILPGVVNASIIEVQESEVV